MAQLKFDETQSRIKQKNIFANRIIAAIALILILFLVLLGRMAYLQWYSHEQYLGLSESNRISLEPLAPERGNIYDRNHRLLAGSRSVYYLTFQKDQIKNLEFTLSELKQILNKMPETTYERFAKQIRNASRHQLIKMPYRLNEEEAAAFAVNSHKLPGVNLTSQMQRYYPHKESAVHLLGYIGRISPDDKTNLDAARYRAMETIGKTGIEKQYEEILHGFPGMQKVEKNSQGRLIRVLETTPATPGKDITLTIDIRLQKLLEDTLAHRRGSAIAMNPNTGEILAFVSTPGYDPNLFIDGISRDNYTSLLNDPNKPLINRATRGQYPPGSTIKPFIALGALEENFISMTERIFDPGYFEFQDRRYRNWKRTGHGWTDLYRSIVESIDTLYYKLSLDMGIDKIHDMLQPFGFGHKTNIDLPSESQGILPSQEWKIRAHGVPWYRGETIISSIGQGYNLTTPLQLAKATSILANRGKVVHPHLLKDTPLPAESSIEPIEKEQLTIKKREHWDYVINAMKDSVHKYGGTAWRSGRHLRTFQAAGKTGTAQVFSLNDGDYKEEELDQKLHDHALFIGFAPVTRPQIAISVIVENAGGGGRHAAPVGLQAISYYLQELQ